MLDRVSGWWLAATAALVALAGVIGFGLGRASAPDPGPNVSLLETRIPVVTRAPEATQTPPISTPGPDLEATGSPDTPGGPPAGTPAPGLDGTVAPEGPTPGETPATTPAVQAANPPTAEEAEDIVRAYFAAVDADNFDSARSYTSGVALETTNAVIATVQQQAAEQGVTVDLRVTRLDTAVLTAEGAVQPVKADFVLEPFVDMGFGPFSLQQMPSSGTFLVARLPAGVRITDIQTDLV